MIVPVTVKKPFLYISEKNDFCETYKKKQYAIFNKDREILVIKNDLNYCIY